MFISAKFTNFPFDDPKSKDIIVREINRVLVFANKLIPANFEGMLEEEGETALFAAAAITGVGIEPFYNTLTNINLADREVRDFLCYDKWHRRYNRNNCLDGFVKDEYLRKG